MKIIVVDDHIAAQETVTVALASDPATKHHAVTGVRTPDELHRIDDLGTFGLAFVDLDFRRQSRKTGLFALRLLDRAHVPAVIYAADDEDNQSDRNAIAEVTDVSRSKVDSFLNEHSAVVA